MNADQLLAHYEEVADAPEAIPRLRRFILNLAVRGKLVPQDPNDEPASELLERVAEERAELSRPPRTIKSTAVQSADSDTTPFNIPRQWTWATVQELMHIEMGQSPPSEHYNQVGEGLPFFQGKADFGPRHPTPRYWCTQPAKLAIPGDILISVRAPVGPTNVADQKCCIGRGLAALRPYGGLDAHFVLMSLQAFKPSIEAMGFGTTFVAINKKQLTSFSLPLPPLPEQRRIVARVDELMALCNRLEASLDTSACLLDALLHSALSPETREREAA